MRHSDVGGYRIFRLVDHLEAAGIAASIGSVGEAYDNALAESAIDLFKTELIEPRRPWKVLSEGGLATDEYVDRYHHRRFCGETVHVPLVEHENNHCLPTTRLRVTPDVSRSPPGPKWFSCLCSGF
ncbi:hypothetical protein [Streptomyces sp. NPDC090093]|uniref:hypothetical protein n=1 Tax=Streptomyces sp. NPDC090093 TaxID=3365945 RepID=UPI0037FEC896